jgi:asparagine synthase (glutamine-hydrolysing)
MHSTLPHRGNGKPLRLEHPTGTLGYSPRFDEPTRSRLGSGCLEQDGIAITLAGYLTNAEALRPALSALLAKYREQGPDFVRDLRGAFVIAIRDGGVLHLFRDGAGVRTVYYGTHAGRFLFASEPKGVLVTPGFPRRIRPAAVAQYLTFSFTPGGPTVLQDLHELPAGHRVTFENGEPVLHRWFFFEDEDGDEASEEVWRDRFAETFRRAVEERLPADEPVGLFLSGGIDSSVVAAEAARRHNRSVKTYALHFGKDHPHELDFARAVALRCRTEHQEILIQPRDFLPRLRRMIWHLDEPIGDPITMPNYELAARVSRDVRWVLNGEGGDPLFGGPKNLPMLLHHWYGGIERGEGFRERMYLASYRRCYDDMEQLLTPEWRRQYDPEECLEGVLRPFFSCERPSSFLNNLMAINIRLKGAHLILPKVERMTSAWGLTALSPFFDERLIRLSFQMPERLKLSNGVEKLVLKQVYADLLPKEVLLRPKSGMCVPVHYWFRGEMKRYARKILSRRSLKQAGIFEPRRVQQILAYDTEGPGRYGLRLWMLITFEIWRRLVVEGESV